VHQQQVPLERGHGPQVPDPCLESGQIAAINACGSSILWQLHLCALATHKTQLAALLLEGSASCCSNKRHCCSVPTCTALHLQPRCMCRHRSHEGLQPFSELRAPRRPCSACQAMRFVKAVRAQQLGHHICNAGLGLKRVHACRRAVWTWFEASDPVRLCWHARKVRQSGEVAGGQHRTHGQGVTGVPYCHARGSECHARVLPCMHQRCWLPPQLSDEHWHPLLQLSPGLLPDASTAAAPRMSAYSRTSAGRVRQSPTTRPPTAPRDVPAHTVRHQGGKACGGAHVCACRGGVLGTWPAARPFPTQA